jgi:hypothetical protein
MTTTGTTTTCAVLQIVDPDLMVATPGLHQRLEMQLK